MRLAPKHCFVDQAPIRREICHSAVEKFQELAAYRNPLIQDYVRLDSDRDSDPDHLGVHALNLTASGVLARRALRRA